MTTLLITGGAGFIGSAVVRFFMANTDWQIINVDKLTYAANLKALRDVGDASRYQLEKEDICDRSALCLLYTSPSPRDRLKSRMPSSA